MENRKKRILFSNEASFLNTGFSNYGMEVLKRLHAMDKYELAEHASYGQANDPRSFALPWKYYFNLPTNEQENNIYNSDPEHQFGKWRFELVCNDFRPDIVCDIRDIWMITHINKSPYRRLFNFCLMPTVDAIPQHENWINDMLAADACFTYTDWALDVLKKQSGDRINLIDSASPAVDQNIFRPVPDKKIHKKNLGLDPNTFIVGTVMRNQKRKLYPELIEAFSTFINQCRNSKQQHLQELAQKTYLYLHTSYPDVGWDIPKLLQRYKIGNRVIVTYVCGQCNVTFPSFFRDVLCVCPKCGQNAAHMPNTNRGVGREVLSGIMNTFDLYIQCSNSEGFGMPQLEAAACEVPVFATDYSAMSDVVRKLEGWPIPVGKYYTESETHCLRALPSCEDLVKLLIKFFTMSEEKRIEMSKKTLKNVNQHYSYDVTAMKWAEYFDNVELRSPEQGWYAPPRFHQPNMNIPNNLSPSNFVRWCVVNIWGMPERIHSPYVFELIKNLQCGAWLEGYMKMSQQPFNQDVLVNIMLDLNEQLNFSEEIRMNKNNPRVVSNTSKKLPRYQLV